jgi:anaerobic magnesium-protoporphyrin IX monomethyl ester cyclase
LKTPDILLAHSYALHNDPKQAERARPYPPLATLYAAAMLQSRGYSVALFDSTFQTGEAAFQATVDRLKPATVALVEDSFHYVVKMCLAHQRATACRMAKIASRSGATVIVSGPDATDHREPYFEHGADYVILGEAENTLCDLMDILTRRATGNPADVPGLVMPRTGPDARYRRSPHRPSEKNLERIPAPAWDLIDASPYRDVWRKAHGKFSLNLASSRGCPFHCNWCSKPTWGQSYASRSPASVAEEMAIVKSLHSPDHIWFVDDVFGLRGNWIAEFAEEVAARGAEIPFTIQSRVDLMTDRAAAALASAGCEEVWMGAESGSQKILDAMDKGIRCEAIGAACARLKAAGIRANLFLQFGYPGETLEDILATVGMVRETLPDEIGVSVTYPLPGTRFYDMVRQELGRKQNWHDSGDLAMMFQGTYRTPFYRRLHALVHQDLTLHRALASGSMNSDSLSALGRLTEGWLELGRLESRERSQSPTILVDSTLRSASRLAARHAETIDA